MKENDLERLNRAFDKARMKELTFSQTYGWLVFAILLAIMFVSGLWFFASNLT